MFVNFVMLNLHIASIVLTMCSPQYVNTSEEPKPIDPPNVDIAGPKYSYQSTLPRDKWARRASGSGEYERYVDRPRGGVGSSESVPRSEKPGQAPPRQDGKSRFQELEDGDHSELNAGIFDTIHKPVPTGHPDPCQLEAGSSDDDYINPARKGLKDPVLLPLKRYCYKDKIVKPHRTHHCRACGTVSAIQSGFF